MNRKFNKKALLASVLSLLLCAAMLLGTTFAWFTDTASSTGNKIVAGKLNVDLELLDKETNVWESIKENKDPIFDYEDWEPGYVDVKILRVENQGTLALKWKAVFVSESSLSDLANVIDVYVKPYGVVADASTVTYPTDRTLDGYNRVGTVAEFVNTIEETTHGILLEGETAYLGIALKMQESAGNEYQEMDLGAFDINIVATQLASEFDSIDDQYDANASYEGEAVTLDELKTVIENGGNVKLANDIVLDDILTVEAGKAVEIDLGGNILAGNIIIEDGAALTVSNGVVENTNNAASAIQTNGGELILNNVTIESARHGVRAEGGSVIINGGTYKVVPTSSMTLHAVNVSDGATLVINGGTFIGPKGTMADSGAAVNVQANSTATINGGNFSGGKNNTLSAKGTLTVNGGTFDQDPSAFASGSTVVNNGDGTWTVKGYELQPNETLATAIQNNKSNISLPKGELTANLSIPAGSNIVISGEGEDTVLSGQIATTSSSAGTIILRNLTIKVSDAIQDSTGISQTGKSAIAIWGNQTVICENVTFDMDLNDSTAITSWWDTGVGTTIIVRNCTFNCNGQRPIRATGNVTVENCTFNDPYRYAVQLTAKASTATELDKAIINFNNNTIVNGPSGKAFVYGIQLEGADYGCHDCVINGAGNTIVNGGTESAMYYCECGKVAHDTIAWNVEVDPVHEN